MSYRRLFSMLSLLALAMTANTAPPSVELSRPFGLKPGWQLLVTQGPETPDPFGAGTEKVPGELHLCITGDGGESCRPSLDTMLVRAGQATIYDRPHYLEDVRIIRPEPNHPLLWVQAASLHGGNGDQVVGTMVLGYDQAGDRFVPVYDLKTGRNNNQAVRYIESGPLRGAIISVEPTSDAPFVFWITVDRLGTSQRYAPVLRYRSVTRYGDGNPLPVIDSDMPETLRRLKLWAPGTPSPHPAHCSTPRLIHGALWCGDLAPAAPRR